MSAGQNVRRGYAWTVSTPKRQAHSTNAGAEVMAVMALAAGIFLSFAAFTDPAIVAPGQHAFGTAWTSAASPLRHPQPPRSAQGRGGRSGTRPLFVTPRPRWG